MRSIFFLVVLAIFPATIHSVENMEVSEFTDIISEGFDEPHLSGIINNDLNLFATDCSEDSPTIKLRARQAGSFCNNRSRNRNGEVKKPTDQINTDHKAEAEHEPATIPKNSACAGYSRGLLPIGVCSSGDPKDVLFAVGWVLQHCTLGRTSTLLSYTVLDPNSAV